MQQTVDDQVHDTGAESRADDTRQRILQAAARVFSEKG